MNIATPEAGGCSFCAPRTLPWLQDAPAPNDVYSSWAVTPRDVVILGRDNIKAAVYNLTTHDLANPIYYGELKALLKSIAGE